MKRMLEELLKYRILMITGKGGIGKSLVSAVWARYAAKEKGLKVCVVESNAEDQIAPLFGHAPIRHQLTEVFPNIHAINIESNANFRDFVVKHLGFEKLFDRIFNTAIVRSFVRMLPGVAELTLLGRLYYLADKAPQKFDLIIFDGFSSGHFLNLLTTPQAIEKAGLIGPVLDETRRVREFFNTPGHTGIVYVTTSEPLVMSECIEFLPRLENADLSHVAGVVVNRFCSEPAISDELRQLSASQDPLAKAAAYLSTRINGESATLEDLKKTEVIHRLGADRIIFMPDVGMIREPLDDQQLSVLLSGGGR